MTEPLDVGRLRLLREVELRGSIAAAARALALTPSAVSQQLAVLEREAGSALLDRSSRGVELTGAGHLLAHHASAVLDQLALARADLDRLGGQASGPLTIAAVASAAATIVSDAVVALGATRPGIELRVIAAEPATSVAMLAAGDADVAVVDEYDFVPLALPDHVHVESLLRESLVLVGPPKASGRSLASDQPSAPVALSELARASWVMPPDDAACGAAVRAACRSAGFEPDVRWVTDDMLLLVRAVAIGHGVAVLPRLAVNAGAGQSRVDHTVSVREIRQPTLHRRLSAVVRSSARTRPIVLDVLDALTTAAVARREPDSR
jgi:DNA-binding transcriptional LysR family regulator